MHEKRCRLVPRVKVAIRRPARDHHVGFQTMRSHCALQVMLERSRATKDPAPAVTDECAMASCGAREGRHENVKTFVVFEPPDTEQHGLTGCHAVTLADEAAFSGSG